MSRCRHNCYTDSETGDLWCPAYGGWQAGGCPLKRREELDEVGDYENDNERNDDDE